MTLGSHTVAVAMRGSLARGQRLPNKVKLSKNGPHVRAMDLGPKIRNTGKMEMAPYAYPTS